ncbi:hypothetical protein AB0C89_34460, partial [Streptomyces sp. NPDC048491]
MEEGDEGGFRRTLGELLDAVRRLGEPLPDDSLLRPRLLRPERRRLRDRDGQLQPGDRLDGLRHLRPPVLRAAHA